jgi:hypothetical protein
MKVKCTDNKINNKEKVYSNLTPNKEYIVLSIEFYNKEISTFSNFIGDYILYRIEDDDGLVKPLPSKLFTIISSQLPRCWISYRENEECYSILPREWAKPSFWEDYYDDEYNALAVFQSVKNQIYADEECN